MSTTDTTPKTTTNPAHVEAIKDSVGDIADILKAEARHAEELGHLGPAAEAALRSTELFRTWWPAELGGPGASVREGIEVIEQLAAVDTAAAWNVAVCTLGSGLAGAYLDDVAIDDIFADELPLIAGQTAPVGLARLVDGGLEVSGSWKFGSGIRLAAWVKAGVVIERDDGSREAVIVVVPADRVTIDEGSWDVAGLAGSGSFDYRMESVHVPNGYWYRFPTAAPARGGPTFTLPIPGQLSILHAGFALGVATRCLEEVTALAGSKVRQFDTAAIANRPTLRFDLAAHSAKLNAARLLTYDVADRLLLAAGTPVVGPLIREMRAAVRHANDVALDLATWAYRQGGGAALHLDHPLQRLLRDMLAATQHIYVDDRAYTDQGATLLGIDPDAERRAEHRAERGAAEARP
ncbi:MAG: acyl-CoA dehydrogenase family protein [Acidimicrobiales bacterium]